MTRTLLFVFGALCLHVALSVAYVQTVVRSHEVRRMDAWWLLGPRAVDVMIAGDSHARFGVEAPILGRAINIAVPGEHYEKSVYRVPWLLDRGQRKVATILLPFDAASFSSFKSESYEPEGVWIRYVDFFELGARHDQRLAYLGKWAKGRFAPYVGELETMLQFATQSRHFRDPNDPQGGLSAAFFEGGPMAARRHLEGADPFDPGQVEAFRHLVEDLVQRGHRVVLIRYPVTRTYALESRRLGGDPALRDALFAEIGRPGVVDQLDLEALLFSKPELFGDGDHLNALGKRYFTTALAAELSRLGVIEVNR